MPQKINPHPEPRRSAEAALRAGGEEFRAVANFTYDWESWIGPERQLRWVNPAVEKLTGYTVSDCMNMDDYPLPIIHPRSRDHMAQCFSEAQSGSSGNDVSFQIQRKDGATLWMAVSWQPILDSEGRRLGYRTSVRDITDRKRMEEKLAEHEEQYRSMFEKHGAIMLLIDADRGVIVDANAAATRFYGYPLEVLRQMRIEDINQLTPESVAAERESASNEQRNFFIFPHRLASGEIRTVEVHSTPVTSNGKTLLFSIIHDITKRKQAEGSLARQTALLNEVEELTHIGGWQWDVKQQTMTWTDELYRIHAFSPDEFEPGSPQHIERSLECYDPEDRSTVKAAFDRCVTDGKPYDLEFPFTAADGVRKWIHTIGRSVWEKDQVVRVFGKIRDITEHKLTEKELEMYQFSLDHSADPIFWINPDASFFHVNEAACKRLGYTQDELLNMSVHDIDPEFPLAGWSEFWKKLTREKSIRLESVHQTKTGELFPVELFANTIKFSKKEFCCTYAHDITDRIELEKQLRQAQKMETIGQLAGGVAHQFNNQLQSILGYTEVALAGMTSSESLQAALTAIQQSAINSADLTRQLLTFAPSKSSPPRCLI